MKLNSLIIPIIGLLILGGVYLWTGNEGVFEQTEIVGKAPDPINNALEAEALGQKAKIPAAYLKYTNERFGFSFYHTPEGRVTVYEEGDGAATVVLEDFDRVRGMQVFIVPYAESTISDERFYKDVPSGVRENIEEVTLDGVRAVTFTSKDMLLGETREIWAIHNGYLYEITTFAGVAQWFTPIIQSWEFLD